MVGDDDVALGPPAMHVRDGGDDVLGGTKGDLAYVVFARRDGGMTDVDLVASGGK